MDPGLADWLEDRLSSGEVLGQGYQATVRRFRDSPSGPLVVKSPHAGSWLAWLGRRAIRREAEVYERLAGIPGIPRSFGLVANEHLVLEDASGKSLRQLAREGEAGPADRERFFGRMLQTILAMHAAGVAHGDLKRKDNTLVGPDETPYLIDFGIAAVDRGSRGMGRIWFDWVRQMDLNAWIKLKHGRRPEALPAEDAALYRPLWIERCARWVRVPWQKLTLRRPRQRWRKRRQQR
jgi:serine/threonine protein kinase